MGSDIERNNFEKIIEQKFEKKMNIIQNDLDNKLNNIKKDLMDYFEKNIKDIILEEIKQLKNGKMDINLENKKEKEKEKEKKEIENENKSQKEVNKKNKIDIEKESKDKNLSNFIVEHKKKDLKFIYFEPKEIDEENVRINTSINDKAYENYLPDKENLINEAAGKFFYSVGGISRVSQLMANKVYYELFEEYKKFLKQNDDWLTFIHEEDRKNLSIWTKNCLEEKEFFEFYSYQNIQQIKKYLYKNDEKTNKILLELFKDLIGLYTKCRLSYPTIVKTEYTNNNCDFSANNMIDCTLKYERFKKVNFCYFPALISNGKYLRNGSYNVFTYSLKNKTFHIEGNIYDYKINEQMPKLYIIPDSKNIKINISKFESGKKKKIKVILDPSIDSELNINYLLYKCEQQKNVKIDEDVNGIFEVDRGIYFIKIKYAKFQEKKSILFDIK